MTAPSDAPAAPTPSDVSRGEVERDDPRAMARELEKWAFANGCEPQHPYWIRGDFSIKCDDGTSLYSDAGHDWCEACADALLAAALPHITEDERRYYEVVAADASMPSDVPAHCMKCGATLRHSLSEYGVAEVVASYQESESEIISPDEAYCISELLGSAPDDEAVGRIGRMALDLIAEGLPPRPSHRSHRRRLR